MVWSLIYSQTSWTEVKWVLGSITTNKASAGNGIPVELFQILQDDAVKGLHSLKNLLGSLHDMSGLFMHLAATACAGENWLLLSPPSVSPSASLWQTLSWNTFFQQHKRRLHNGHHRMVNTEIRLIIFFAAKDAEALYSLQKQDRRLTVAQIMNSLLPT